MGDVFAEIETSIEEVTKARQSVTRGTSKQVFSTDEVDRLKSVAYAWFQTHRSAVLGHLSRPDLQPVDSAYRTVLEATGRHAARKTYAAALLEAKRSLVAVRSSVAAMPIGPSVTTGAVSVARTPD